MNGEHLKKRRTNLKMTLEEVGKMVGVGKSTVRKWETGDIENMKRDKIALLATALRTTPLYIMGLSSDAGEVDFNTDGRIPLIGTICAGDGLFAEENIEDYVHYPFKEKRQPDYALRVKGDSMEGAGIDDGDIVYMRKAQWAEFNGQIVAAIIGNENGTLKHLRWNIDSPTVQLTPENDKYETIEVYPNQISICGLYTGHFKPEKRREQ
ncbi:LexA family protein [Paenibacillus cymbidii]|uniref:LexA family protein n=1 Tax=Paenibacillus cymbidii TaxID=1639034 RepID=UPI001A9AE017|nr:S24 family peptidase [Paenibacillus cymbidii]